MTMAMSCHDNKHHQQFSSSSPSSIHSNSNATNNAMEGGQQQGQYSLLKDRWNHIHQQTLVEQNELMKYFMKSMEDIWNKQNNDVQKRIFFSSSKDEIDNESNKSNIIKDDGDNKGLLLIPRLVTTKTADASSPGALNNSSNRSHQFAHQGNTKELSPVLASSPSPSSTIQRESTTKKNDIEYKMERMILKEQLKKQRKEIEELKIKLLKARNLNEKLDEQSSARSVTEEIAASVKGSSSNTHSPKLSNNSSSSVRSKLHDSRNSSKMNQSQPIKIDYDLRANEKGMPTTPSNTNRRNHTNRQSRRHSDVVVAAPISPTESNKRTTGQTNSTTTHKENSCDKKKSYDALEEQVLLKATKLKKSTGTNKYYSSRSSKKNIKNTSDIDGRADDPLNKTWHGSRATAGMKKHSAASSLSSRHHLDKLSDNINQVSSDIRNLHRLQKTLMHNRRNSLDMNDDEKHKKILSSSRSSSSSSSSRVNERFGKSLDIGLLMTEPKEDYHPTSRKPDGYNSMTLSSTISSAAFRKPVASTSSSSMNQSASIQRMDETMNNSVYSTLNLSSNSLDLEHEVLDNNNTYTSDQTMSFHQSTSTTTTSTQDESSSLELMLHSYSSTGDKKKYDSYNDLHQTSDDNDDEEEEEDHDDGNDDDEEDDSILLALKQDQDLLFMESQSTAHLYNESMSSFHRADSGNSSSIICSQRGRRSNRRNNNNDDDNTTISDDTLVKNIPNNLGRSGSLLLHDHDDVLVNDIDEVPNTNNDRLLVKKQNPVPNKEDPVQGKQGPVVDKQDPVLEKCSKPAQPRRGSLSGGNRSGLIQKRKLLARLKRRNVTADLA